jgi:hypothetical protein
MIAKEGVDVMRKEGTEQERNMLEINIRGGNIAYPSIKVIKTSASSSALRKASCMMDSPTDTRIRPDGDMRNGRDGNRMWTATHLRAARS